MTAALMVARLAGLLPVRLAEASSLVRDESDGVACLKALGDLTYDTVSAPEVMMAGVRRRSRAC
jgi:hypothetical protein